MISVISLKHWYISKGKILYGFLNDQITREVERKRGRNKCVVTMVVDRNYYELDSI